ncbi:MAG: hypothetical protein H0X03_05425 [Nitrosopumilus sp.]|nr:hypothetical protein [Nitrosopumilus sp.]
MNQLDNNIIYELHKLCSVILPEKTTWSIDEIYNQLFQDPKYEKQETTEILKKQLKSLEGKEAVIFVDGFNSINLVEPKLLELVDIPRQNDKS